MRFNIQTQSNLYPKYQKNLSKQVFLLKENYLNKNDFFFIIRKFIANKKDLKNQKKIHSKFLNYLDFFGKIIPQNNKGDKILYIKPNLKKLKNKSEKENRKLLRYHETNFGGSIHTDGPQLLSPPKYLAMLCLQKSNSGGKTILVNSNTIFDFLKNKNLKILNILKKKFYFEKRGFESKNTSIIKKPIFKKIKGKNSYSFCYLKEYLLRGYELKKKKLSRQRSLSLKLLDNCLNDKKFQKKVTLNNGDLILINNQFICHGRTKFKMDKNVNRTLLRAWVK